MNIPKFKILTSISALDIPYESDSQFQKECESLVKEQDEILKKMEYDLSQAYLLYFFRNNSTLQEEISEGIQYLSIKEGYDLVLFEDGKPGYVAYYGENTDGFEIRKEKE